MAKKAIIIGAGFSGLSAACYLGKNGYEVCLLEKNASIGGRARQFQREGFTFDMGPTFYWMPDVFERFFADFGKKPSDFYELVKLDPAYTVFFGEGKSMSLPDSPEKIYALFEKIEPGSGAKLRRFLAKAKANYAIAMGAIVYRPGVSPWELVSAKTAVRLHLFFTSIDREIRRLFRHPQLIRLLEFPVLFLGVKPSETPAFYNFMNYADFGLGTWHPKGGMFSVVNALKTLAESFGCQIRTESSADKICVQNGKITGLMCNGEFMESEIVLSSADYHHSESLLDKRYRHYSEAYWNKRTFAPSALLFYVGFDRPIPNLAHHNLCFDADFDRHIKAIYDRPKWPEEPLFYASFPSKTDKGLAPDGKENGIFLIPLAPGIEGTQQLRQAYFDKLILRLESLTGENIAKHLIFEESFCVSDFKEAYNSYKGNAYGLANTLRQTAFLRPKLKSKTVDGLYFSGQLTVPGPGVPPALISGKLAAELIEKHQ